MESFDLPSHESQLHPTEYVRSLRRQALHMLNDGMIAGLAKAFAERVRPKRAVQDPEKQVGRAYWIALSRPPNDEERKISLDTCGG